MTDRHIGAMVVGVWCAALVPVGSSIWLFVAACAVAVVAWWMRWPVLLVLVLVGASSLSAGVAWAGLDADVPDTFVGEARLVSDPAPTAGGVRVTAAIDGVHYDLRAWGSPAGHLRHRLMGEVVEIEANLRPLDGAPMWLRARGITGRGTVTAVDSYDVGQSHTRLANSIRRTIESGASSLSRDQQSLFAGLVYGDDRTQSPLVADNFNAAGLTHLLAVSGQNVAFVLSIAGPVLRRLTFRPRFAFILGVLLLFATVTRFEPSVVRASVMTAVAAVGSLVGAEVSSRRVLALAIAGLVIVDPLIVHSIAFQLSVAASAGILFWSGRVARAIPGPRVFAEALAVTATAQIAVAPLLVWRFDGLPVASLPANLLAGPAAGPVMMWGLTGGLLAGLVPSWLAEVLHLPTRFLVGWIDGVAAAAPKIPLGQLGAVHLLLLFGAGWAGLRATRERRRIASLVIILAVLAYPAAALAAAEPTSISIDGDSILLRDTQQTVLVLDSASRPEEILSSLRRRGVGDIDMVVVRDSNFANAQMVRWLQQRHDVEQVMAPEATLGVGEIVPAHGQPIAIAGHFLHFTLTEDHLDLHPG